MLARFVTALVLAFFFFAAPPVFAQPTPESGVAQRRAQCLRHGINWSEWFAQAYDAKGYTKEHFETWNTAQDVALTKAMGWKLPVPSR